MQKQYPITQPQHLFNYSSANAIQSNALYLIDVLIFKTNIQTIGDRIRIKKTLDGNPLILQWNIDLEDIDCVLRIEATHLDHNDIIKMITGCGYNCEELMW